MEITDKTLTIGDLTSNSTDCVLVECRRRMEDKRLHECGRCVFSSMVMALEWIRMKLKEYGYEPPLKVKTTEGRIIVDDIIFSISHTKYVMDDGSFPISWWAKEVKLI